MKHVIIGTAGHVDHGKTALVKALTGIDTDRLEEEKRRGVTIEPGFAYLDFDDGSRAGLIDVPGHERFIRNMLAGSGGIDLAMLVVAADEGVMLQTREHLGILTQLGISDGLVVITKSDKADPDWMELVEDDVMGLVSGTFLENNRFIQVSAVTGAGISELKNALHSMIEKVTEKNVNISFRLPVDRVFPVDGFGTVVTGTLIEGMIKVGDFAEILPSGEKAPVRNIQVHGKNTETAYAGQRTAISLAGVKKGNIKRGDVLSAVDMMNVSGLLDVKLNIFKDSDRTVKNGSELHIYHGAMSTLSKVFLFTDNELVPGESCYARLKLKESLPCKRGDRFVIRFFSPVETIGGGIILDSAPVNRIKRNDKSIDALKIREAGNLYDIADLAAFEIGTVFTEMLLCKRTDIDMKTCSDIIEELIKNESIIKLLPGKYVSGKVIDRIGKESKDSLTLYHKSNPLRSGMNIAELRQKLIPDIETPEANAVITVLQKTGDLKLTGNIVSIPGFMISYTPVQNKIHEKLMTEFRESVYDTKSPDELVSLFPKNEKRDFNQLFESMISSGELIMLSPQIYWLQEHYENAVNMIKNHFNEKNDLTLAECRDILNTSRKYALAFLEHLDGKQVTKMTGDSRVISKGFI